MKRAILIVLDSVGVGALPDAASYNDEGANTVGHIAQKTDLKLPNMCALGFGHIPNTYLAPASDIVGAYGRAGGLSAAGSCTGAIRRSGHVLCETHCRHQRLRAPGSGTRRCSGPV